jgi:creatinine amidohydrolase
MTVYKWRELSTTDYRQMPTDKMLAILPIGSMEQHGPHLPVGTDSMIVEAIVGDVMKCLEGVDCVFLPTVWCSKSNEHFRFPGTVYLSRETFGALLEDIGASVARTGFKKMVFMNFHGGNTDIVSVLLRDIRQKTGMMTFAIDALKMGACMAEEVQPWSSSAHAFEIHAGHGETSVILARYPRLMEGRNLNNLGSDMERGKTAAAFKPFEHLIPEGGPVTVGWVTDDLTADGVVGNPATANAEDGNRRLAAQVALVCKVLKEIAAFEFK